MLADGKRFELTIRIWLPRVARTDKVAFRNLIGAETLLRSVPSVGRHRWPLRTTAASTAQCVYSRVSSARLQKTRIFSVRLETFENSRSKKRERQSLETLGDDRSPRLAGLSHQEKKIL